MRRVCFLLLFCLVSAQACSEPARGPKYLDVKPYEEGLAPAKAMSGKWGFINDRQQWVIRPVYQDVKPFKDGKAAAMLNGKWGFINTRGEWL